MKVCKYCFKEFDVNSKVFANHVRWCVENRTNGDKGSSKLSKIGKERYRILRGRDKEFEVNCYRCKKEIKVIEPEFKFPMKEKYFCDNKCMFGGRINAFPKDSDDHKKKTGERTKELWKDPKYVEKMINNNTLRNKRFSSIGELEIKKYFQENYPDDDWTSGGSIKFKNTLLTRDIYSNKLKICIEYDGIWHFKDIHGQLLDKQLKDRYLDEWCLENGWRMIRIKEDIYKIDKISWLKTLSDVVYNSTQSYKFY